MTELRSPFAPSALPDFFTTAGCSAPAAVWVLSPYGFLPLVLLPLPHGCLHTAALARGYLQQQVPTFRTEAVD